MGRKAARSSLADALFTPVQQRVMGLLFGQPERRFQSAEIYPPGQGGGTGAVHRQLSRLDAAGLVSVSRTGRRCVWARRFGACWRAVTRSRNVAEYEGDVDTDEHLVADLVAAAKAARNALRGVEPPSPK
jgi:hypothetical protein